MRAPRLVVVLVVDGLRPDAITAADTPALCRLRADGVEFTSSHAVFPTVTRVNAATLVTGAQPGTHGIGGNQMYVPAVQAGAFGTDDHRRLVALDQATSGRLLLVPALAERLATGGLGLAAVSSGSTGSAWLLNHRAAGGTGVLVNGFFSPGRTVAHPPAVNEAVLARFGPAPPKGGAAERYDAVVAWTQRVLCEYVLPELAPAVAVSWLTEPDHTQHVAGVGASSARAAIRTADNEVARVMATVERLGLADATDVFVVSDHGFTTVTGAVDVVGELVAAGLKATRDSDDVVVASSGQAVGVHVAGRDPGRIDRLARFMQSRDWGGVVFAAAREPGDPRGVPAGTFSLDLIHAVNVERGPDLIVSFPWTSTTNAFGMPGTDLAHAPVGTTPYAGDHGSLSPWNVRNTLLAWGAGFKRGARVAVPAGNVDVTPTILARLGLSATEGIDGRVLTEALADGPDPEQVAVETLTHAVTAGAYRAAVQVSVVDGRRYLDTGWRES